MVARLHKYLKLIVDKQASDLYLKAGVPAYLRIEGRITPVSDEKLTAEDLERILDLVMNPDQKQAFITEKEMDLAYEAPQAGRFRVNVFIQRGKVSLVFRAVREDIRSFTELNLPVKVLEELSLQPRGLVLITGTAGSGKSTTLASMVEFINQNQTRHIITIEDPIEFLFEDKKSIVSQREVGLDTRDFHRALRHIIRQSPDVIFIGEMRDLETISSAIMAAETGHLVLSTLHTIDAIHTIERMINFFPAHQHSEIRMQISLILKGVVSLRLLNTKDGRSRVPACEIMLPTPTVRKLILEGKTTHLYVALRDGELFGMQTFNQSLLKLYQQGLITQEEAVRMADRPEELELNLKGIYSGKDTHQTAPS